MNKKYLALIICGSALMIAGFTGAVTSVENSTSGSIKTENNELKGNVETEVKVSGEPSNETNDVNRDSQRVLPTVNKIESKDGADDNSERLLPTVNKKSVAKVMVRGWDPDKKAVIEAKVRAALENNSEIKIAEISEDNVTINYMAPGKFLGLFPMNFGMQVSSDAQARVKVKFPWYRFLLKTEFANTAELVNGVFQHNQTDLEFLKSKTSEDRQVEIFIKVSNTLKVMHDMAKPIIGNIRA